MDEKAEVLYLLQYMSKNSVPVGSGKACKVLQDAGFQVSEATVGRLLRYMDANNYTFRSGFKGRMLTPYGRDCIYEYLQIESQRKYSEQLAEIIRSQSLEDLLATLVARRAIEREIARLAAINITPGQEEELRIIMNEYKFACGNRIASGDVAFHQALAEAAGNKVLKAAQDLIRQDGQLSPVLGFVREQLHRKVFSDHKQIFDAIVARDSLAAEQAMVSHIENLIADVKKYWTQVNGSE